VVPGDAFGAAEIRHVRCACATSNAHLDEALRRIEQFVAGLHRAEPDVVASAAA
jgi:aspartate/methionine/tyrosine aminotransferase